MCPEFCANILTNANYKMANSMKRKALHLIFLTLIFSVFPAQGQTYPSLDIQQRMLAEEQAFLANMKAGLQHTQTLAVRAAMNGNDTTLQQIRQSRNQPPVLPDGVTISRPTPDICLFAPARQPPHKRPLLLYLHGGGWCFGSINSCARFCTALALEADCCVAALNYCLAPAHPYPAPLTDCQQAFVFLKQHAAKWGCDSTQVSVGGDSAGGNLAIATAMTVEGVCKLIPIYPVTKLFTEPTPSWKKYAKGYGNDAELLEAFNEAYARQEERNPLVSVGLADDKALQSLPPMLIISAGHDILFDQTAELAQRLQRLNHPLRYHVYPTATHLFITVPGQPTAFGEAVKDVADFLNSSE